MGAGLPSHQPQIPSLSSSTQQQLVRRSSGWSPNYGFDLTFNNQKPGDIPKVVIEGYGPQGFEFSNIVKKIDRFDPSDFGNVTVHGSVLVFPSAVFQWNVTNHKELTMDSLAPVALHFPKIRTLYIGCNDIIPYKRLKQIMDGMQDKFGVSVEKAELYYTIGTFNFLNGEGRDVAVALIQDPNCFEDDDE